MYPRRQSRRTCSQNRIMESLLNQLMFHFVTINAAPHPSESFRSFRSSPRPISTGQLSASPRLHSRPINHVVYMGPYSINWMGYLILRMASRLDAFSAYPEGSWLPSYATGVTTGAPLEPPSRSSRTRDRPSQISYAHDR